MKPKLPESQVIRAASKRLPILPDRKLSEHLSYAADDLAHAYRIGAEEAQSEIVARLRDLYQRAAARNVGTSQQPPTERTE